MPAESIFNQVPKLVGENNYVDWKFAIMLALCRVDHWNVVSGVTKKPKSGAGVDEWKKTAVEELTDIGLTISPAQYVHIPGSCADGAEAWTALFTLYEKVSRANQILIKHQLYRYVHDVGKPIQTYITDITNLAAHLEAIRVTLTAVDITDVLIFNLNALYSIIAGTLATSKDEMSVAAVSGMLIDEERRKEGMEGMSNQGGDTMTSAMAARHTGGPILQGVLTCYRCDQQGHTAQFCPAPAPIRTAPVHVNITSNVPIALTAVSMDDVNFVFWRFCSYLFCVYLLMLYSMKLCALSVVW